MRELNRLLSLTFGLDQRPTRSSFQIEQSRLDANAMAKAKRLAAKHGITIDKERKNAPEAWVYVKGLEAKDDPCNGNQFCLGGREVLAAVEVYVAHLSKV